MFETPFCMNCPQCKFDNFNTLRPKQNGRHFPDDIFKWIFLKENVWISIDISLKFVPRGPINNIPTLVQVMSRRLWGDKPLSEPMMVKLPTHICVTRPQWVDFKIRSLTCGGVWIRDESFGYIAANVKDNIYNSLTFQINLKYIHLIPPKYQNKFVVPKYILMYIPPIYIYIYIIYTAPMFD